MLKTSFHLSYVLKRPIHWGWPVAVSIEPTTACNLRCPQCPSGLRSFTRTTGNLKTNTNEKILSELSPWVQYINYYFQGEPFIHPQFSSLVQQARQKNIYVATSTNAHFIDKKMAHEIIDSGLTELIVSIDGMSQETYANYRIDGSLEKVKEGISAMIQAKKERNSVLPVVTLQFLVSRQNEHELDEIKAFQESSGADQLRLKTLQIYDEKGVDLIPKNQEFSRYDIDKNGKAQLKNKFKNSCWRMWSSCVITWDGTIVPCCFDKDAVHAIGNIQKEDFKSIWKKEIYQSFRSQILHDRQQIEICKNCSEGSKILI